MTEPQQPGPPPGREQPQYETYGGENFFEPPPGETQMLPVGPPPPDPRRRRTMWIVGGVVAVLLVAGGVAVVVATSGPSSAASAPAAASPSDGNTPPAKGHGKGAKGEKHKKGDSSGGALAGGASEVQGAVASVSPGKLTITPSGMAPITVNTTDSTKVSGTNASSMSDVAAGQQVIVVIKDGAATTIRIKPAG